MVVKWKDVTGGGYKLYGCLVQLVRTLVRKARDIGSSPKRPHLENHHARDDRFVSSSSLQY